MIQLSLTGSQRTPRTDPNQLSPCRPGALGVPVRRQFIVKKLELTEKQEIILTSISKRENIVK